MKIRLYVIVLLGLSLLLAACKKESNPTDPGGGETGNYFPAGIGTYYKFSIESEDSAGVASQGQRSTRYTGIKNINGTDFIEELDSLFRNNITTTTTAHFRRTDSGVFYFLDTTGLGAIIPDSMLQYITFDSQLREFAFPLEVGDTWPVFKMTLNYIISLNIINVNATVMNKENILLSFTTGEINKEALKIRYILTLTIPDPNNPLVPFIQNLEAYCWVVKDIGIVRWQGNATVMGAFSGSGIEFGDSATTVTQDLITYNIK